MGPVAVSMDEFLCMWNNLFPNSPLTPPDLELPSTLMNSLLLVFEKIGIDIDAVLMPPGEESLNEHMVYYQDLIPFINCSRVINHLAADIPQFNVHIQLSFLQHPTRVRSHCILLVMINLLTFKQAQASEIAVVEEDLMKVLKEIRISKDKKNELMEMINEKAREKARSQERQEQLDKDTLELENEIRQREIALVQNRQRLEASKKEEEKINELVAQKRSRLNNLLDEIEKRKSLRVPDPENIIVKAETVAKNLQEAEKHLNSLSESLGNTQNEINVLEKGTATLEFAITILNKISRNIEDLRELEEVDLDTDSYEGEMNVLNTELSELEHEAADAKAALAADLETGRQIEAESCREKAELTSAFQEIEENCRQCQENVEAAQKTIEEIKQNTWKYEQQKSDMMNRIVEINQQYTHNMDEMHEVLIGVVKNSGTSTITNMRNILRKFDEDQDK